MTKTYKTFRWRIHDNTHRDMDIVLNALPASSMIEGYACNGEEIFVTVSDYTPYRKEIDREVARMELRAKK